VAVQYLFYIYALDRHFYPKKLTVFCIQDTFDRFAFWESNPWPCWSS